MGDHTVKRIDEMEGYYLGAMKRARAELGVTSFGLQVLQMPPNITAYPEHDHAESGQEEVFAVLRGDGRMVVGGEEIQLTPDVIVRVGPGEKRKIASGPEGLRILALGAVPGAAYEINPATELEGNSA